jgi:hypothetical protein
VETGPQAYDSPSIKYVDGLANATLKYLDRFADAAPSDPGSYHIYRQKLWDLRSSWAILHNFIEPAVDADTLRLPLSLIQWLTQRLNTIPGCNASRFVVFHTSEVNYLHLNTSWVRSLAGQLSALVPGGQPFPSDLGLIGIPYSQGSTLCLNCLIPHEMGHYVYQETNGFKKLLPHIGHSIGKVLAPKIASVTPPDLQWCLDRIQSWAQETFCDLFATWMIGPAYAYAYIEIFDLSRLLNPDGKALDLECEFNSSHPSHVFRLQRQIQPLIQLGWWPYVEHLNSHYSVVLQVISKVDPGKFTFSSPEKPHMAADTLASFELLSEHIHAFITSLLNTLDSGVAPFKEYQKDIRNYLSRAIVPSSIIHKGVLTYPDPIAIVNAAYGLQLEALEELINHIESQDPTSVLTRSQWIDRLELWTMKAIEDNGLLIRQKV